MKTAIYIEDGTIQLVITPETEFEKNALTMFREKPMRAEIFAGSFYDCRGGWVRQSHHCPAGQYVHESLDREDRSLIIRYNESGSGSGQLEDPPWWTKYSEQIGLTGVRFLDAPTEQQELAIRWALENWRTDNR